MIKKCGVVIYTDSIVFGGHEVTLYDAIIGMIESDAFEIVVILSEKNKRFINKLSALSETIQIITTQYETSAGDVFRVLFKMSKVKAVAKTIMQFNPDAVIVSQGAIALSACGLGVRRKIGPELISFLPMAHLVAATQKNNSFSFVLQDILYKRLYAIPDYFFTICQNTANQLHNIHNIDKDKIFVTYYGIDTSVIPEVKYRFEKFTNKRKKIGIIGRVEFYQKRHDFLLQELAANNSFSSSSVYVIGDGPDMRSCKKLVSDLGITDHVHFIGWVDDVSEWYEELDAIVLPSRFEGLPLVVIEAMYYGVPIIASCVDGMKEILPQKWLFDEGDGNEMISTINHVLFEDQTELVDYNQKLVFIKLTKEKFKKQFSQNLQKICFTS